MKILKNKNIVAGLVGLGLVSVATLDAQTIGVNKCYACHGTKFERKAMGKSQIVKDMNKTQIVDALVGYQNGTYGGALKGVMKGQVIKYNHKQLEQIAQDIQDIQDIQ